MSINIKGLTRRELLALQSRVEKALKKLADADKKTALQAAEKAAKQHGFSLSELTGASVKSPQKPARRSKARYRNPDDASKTWTGKGRRPDWIKAGLAKGKSLDDYAI